MIGRARKNIHSVDISRLASVLTLSLVALSGCGTPQTAGSITKQPIPESEPIAPTAIKTQSPSLLKNGSFEEDEKTWSSSGAILTDKEAHSGKKSLCVGSAGNAGTKMICFDTPPLQKGQYYRADVWVKVKNGNTNKKVAPLLCIGQQGSYGSTDRNEWEMLSHLYKAEQDAPVQITLRYNDADAELYADDLSFRKCEYPNIEPLDFENNSTLGLCFHGDSPSYRIVEGDAPEGKKYLTISGTYTTYRMEEPIKNGDVYFDFMVKSQDPFIVQFPSFRFYIIPTLRIGDSQRMLHSLGTINPGTWNRIQGTLHLEKGTLDIKITDLEDPLGVFEKKNIKVPMGKDGVTAMDFCPSAGKEIHIDNIYLRPRKTNR